MIPIRACAAFSVSIPSALHDLAQAFHAGDAAAIDMVTALVAEAVRSGTPGLMGGQPSAVVVIPGHRPGSVNEPCLALADRLAGELGWPAPSAGALERVALAPEGRAGMTRAPDAEAATLRWHPDALPADGAVLLLDDVVRTGSTLAAAEAAAPEDLAARLEALAVFRAQDRP